MRRITPLSFSEMQMLAPVASAFLFFACDSNNPVRVVDEPPAAPQGVYTVRGDNAVQVYWLPVEANDLDHYRVYRGLDSADGAVFSFIGNAVTETYLDGSATNGVRYFYTVTAVDAANQESRQSLEDAGATPRVDGFNRTLVVNDVSANSSGFNFPTASVVRYDSPLADFWIDRDLDGILYINGDTIAPFGDIQDMGYTSSLDEIGYAPNNGWSQLGYSEIIAGHTYVLWTGALRYAKVRVTGLTAETMTFDYAYQAASAQSGGDGEPQLVIGKPEIIRDATAEKVKSVARSITTTSAGTTAPAGN